MIGKGLLIHGDFSGITGDFLLKQKNNDNDPRMGGRLWSNGDFSLKQKDNCGDPSTAILD